MVVEKTASVDAEHQQEAAHEKKIESSCEEVRQIALNLHHQSVYPSESRVSELMTKPGDLRNRKVRLSLQEVQSELSK